MYKINYFNFKERKDNYLITNDIGNYMFIKKSDFSKLTRKEKLDENIEKQLKEKGFIFDNNEEIFATEMAMKLRKTKSYLLVPTSLHIFVVSKNCNFNCIYCQAGNLNEKQSLNMTKETAKRAVDIAMESPSEYLTFEFQGGEPLLNYEVIKFIIEYSKEINNGKCIEYNLVSNLTLLTTEMIDFFKENNVSICTSIDGDEKLQNINRHYKNKNSYLETTNQIRKLKDNKIKVNAIETTTKYSLDKYKDIVDKYIELGFDSIFVRPLTRLGKADDNWKKIGYEVEDFLKFYKNILEYVIEKNKKGI